MSDYRKFEPVEKIEAPSRLSQTFLRHMDSCPRSAYLYLRHRGGPSNGPMNRGSAFHKFAERMAVELIRRGEKSLFAPTQRDPNDPGDRGEDLSSAARDVASLTEAMVEQVFADHPEYVVPARERDSVRVMAYHLAIGWDVDPETIVGVERMFALELDCGWRVVGKVDLAALPTATLGEVVDFKTTLAVPSAEDHEKSFQAKLYALLLMYGRPMDENGELGDCIGTHLTHVKGRMIYPRAKPRETEHGLRLIQRSATWTRGQLYEFRLDVEALGRRVTDGLESGNWPAQASTSACGECPAPAECPIPRELRNYAGVVNEPAQASEAWEWAERMAAKVAAVRREVKEFAKAHGGVVVGDEVWEWQVSEARRLRSVGGRSDWDGLQDAVLRAVNYGEPFDVEEFVRWSPKNEFKSRPLAADEEMQDERAADERSPDERWGADAPF